MSMRRSKVCVPRAYVLPGKCLTWIVHPAAPVDKELVVTGPEFDDPNIDPDALPLGKHAPFMAETERDQCSACVMQTMIRLTLRCAPRSPTRTTRICR